MNTLSRKFPYTRSRRLRSNRTIRDLVAENQIQVNKLIQPVFVSDTNKKNVEITTMPGQKLFSKLGLFKEIETLQKIGIGTVRFSLTSHLSKKIILVMKHLIQKISYAPFLSR